MGHSFTDSYLRIRDEFDRGGSSQKKRVVSLGRLGRPPQCDWGRVSAKKARVYRGFVMEDDDCFKLGCCRRISSRPHILCKVKEALRRMNKLRLYS